jgi:hypothetical protein
MERYRRYEAPLARGRILAYLDEHCFENALALGDVTHALERTAAPRVPSQHEQAVELRERLTAVR